MKAQLFWLSNTENADEIFAHGVELSDVDIVQAVTFRRDSDTQRAMVDTHDSAEASLKRYERRLPLTLHWDLTDYSED